MRTTRVQFNQPFVSVTTVAADMLQINTDPFCNDLIVEETEYPLGKDESNVLMAAMHKNIRKSIYQILGQE